MASYPSNVQCRICRVELPKCTQRRTLVPPSISTKETSEFFTKLVAPCLSSHSDERVNACKPCYNKIEKTLKALSSVKATIGELRQSMLLPPADIQLQVKFPEIEADGRPGSALRNPASPPPSKKPRLRGTMVKSKRSLSFDSPSQTEDATRAEFQEAGTQTPEVKVSR